jgi:hypothetical protein
MEDLGVGRMIILTLIPNEFCMGVWTKSSLSE